jgi:hypothetical protein
MPPLSDALTPWQGFYTLLGGASATMVGLLFVAASISSGAFTAGRTAASRMFLSSSVVHFSGILAVCLIVMTPVREPAWFGGMIGACGVFGLGYYGWTWFDALRDGLAKRLEWDDRFWYAWMPAAGYAAETASGGILMRMPEQGCIMLAASSGLLLLIAIHNAWDITVWSLMRNNK